MTEDEAAEYDLLKLATSDTHKFAVQIGYPDLRVQQALERLQLRDWVRLIDVTPVSAGVPNGVCRVFRVMPRAVKWVRAQG